MPRSPLTRRKSPLTIASRLLLDHAGNPIIDLAGNPVAVNKSPQSLTRRSGSLNANLPSEIGKTASSLS